MPHLAGPATSWRRRPLRVPRLTTPSRQTIVVPRQGPPHGQDAMNITTEGIDLETGEGSPSELLSVVIPCLNEAENIELCVTAAINAIASAKISGEVIVCDNGSIDGSAELAELAGAHVVHEPARGYGNA